MRSRIFVILVAVAFSLPVSLSAQGKGQGKAPDKTAAAKVDAFKGTTKRADANAPDAKATSSNKGGDTRSRERATEAQTLGKGAEQRGFATPKGLTGDSKSKDSAKTSGDKKDKDKSKDKAKDNNKDKSKTDAKDAKESGKSKAKGKS